MHPLDEKVIPTIRKLYDSDYGILAILLGGRLRLSPNQRVVQLG
jgi:hypothetical protein